MKEIISNNFAQVISTLGAIGSMVGAWIAWLQYKKAESSAKNAESAERKLLEILKRNELSRDSQKIIEHIQRLSKYVRRGLKTVGSAGLNLNEDIDKAIELRNHLASSARYSHRFKDQLISILHLASSMDFKTAPEADRVSAVKGIIENFSHIAVSLDSEVTKDV